MNKDSFGNSVEYKWWRIFTALEILFFLAIFACALVWLWNIPSVVKGLVLVTLAVLMILTLCLTTIATYISYKRMYRMRMNGWTPLDAMNPKGHFFASAILKFIDEIKGR